MFWHILEDDLSGGLFSGSIALHNREGNREFSRETVSIVLDRVTLYRSSPFPEIIHKFRNRPFFELAGRTIHMDRRGSVFRVLIDLERDGDTLLFGLEDHFFCECSFLILFFIFERVAYSDRIALLFDEFVFGLVSEFLKFAIIIEVPFYTGEIIPIVIDFHIRRVKGDDCREAHIDIRDEISFETFTVRVIDEGFTSTVRYLEE